MQEYEFTGSQNELIEDLAARMNFVGILMIIGAILSLVASLATLLMGETKGVFDLSAVVQAAFLFITGWWTRNAAQSFNRVVNTTGSDIENILAALGELRKLYALQYWLIILTLVALAVIFIVGLLVTVSGR